MRKIYFILAGTISVAGLILAFENITVPAQGMRLFFDTATGSLFFPLIFVFILGLFGGFFLGMGVSTHKEVEGGDRASDFDL